MKNIKLLLAGIFATILIAGCSDDFLEYEPEGVLSNENVATAENAEALVVAAYAGIANDDMVGPLTNMWVYGSVRSDDAYKGGGGRGDVDIVDRYEQYNLTIADDPLDWMGPRTWTNYYKAISRANFALKVINDIPDAEYANKAIRQGELRFLRAHSHFMLKLLFKKIPYITEELTQDEIIKVSNDVDNDALWNTIADDFIFAYDNLPQSQDQVGRADKNAAAAYLAKLRLYQAYEQNDTHAVTNINMSRLQEVIDYANDVTGALEADYGNNYLDGFDNGSESIWAAQFSINDGTTVSRVSFVTGLNSPHGTGLYGCCGFHLASHNMVNAFKTDASGLPLLDTFNDSNIFDVVDANGETALAAGITLDPRIDHTVGIPGRPFKYRNTVNTTGDMIYNFSWARDPGVYGYFGNMKEQQAPDCGCYVKEGPFVGTSKNVDFIRYADVLLFKAEALIQLDQVDAGVQIINQIRRRAKESTQRQMDAGASNVYNVGEYAMGMSKDDAFKALMFERRLEFGMEGPRFFDLVRWGMAEQVLNAYLAVEKTRKDFLTNANFTAGRDEYYPIPQREIDFTGGIYKQNPGY
ncbi:RagB/SusD family nutrient uptake outer membrane protein [Polaribacter reichenbachii]|uniref:Glycan metabolism protein RagB n=1 Tax=Polaribacter reichenbachii TaxID=996801 RepID=A0A1B8U7A8_9FLAO|nr:RagB/SusD family nutrient uptake outer membrane protein [Polaribacter reichenbachii]APZ46337.1 RagB/SusD family nutrient uptake outer membrane protein [Polaribacter reichenbachii]AUC20201.1 RagB/SusD family nutrient uptake outer membrane protein [Polaribacter reichenbachii]OBY67708.1 glycan metabolism protein RagB [Polaribacter reichenbachii]